MAKLKFKKGQEVRQVVTPIVGRVTESRVVEDEILYHVEYEVDGPDGKQTRTAWLAEDKLEFAQA